VSQMGSLIAGGGGGGGEREGGVVQTGVGAVGAVVGAVMVDGLEVNLGPILGMVQ
jgi:hypothetical protein